MFCAQVVRENEASKGKNGRRKERRWRSARKRGSEYVKSEEDELDDKTRFYSVNGSVNTPSSKCPVA